jgi:hypothetical protein
MSGTMDLPGVNAREVAVLALRAAIEEIAAIQQRMALAHVAEMMHGDRALPQREFFRTFVPKHGTALTEASRYRAEETKADSERLAKLTAIVEALEASFRDERAAHDEAFMEAMAEHLRASGWRAKRKDQ